MPVSLADARTRLALLVAAAGEGAILDGVLTADLAAILAALEAAPPAEDTNRADVILIRRYLLQHDGRLGGECVAWERLKRRYGVARDNAGWEQDLAWLAAYERQEAAA